MSHFHLLFWLPAAAFYGVILLLSGIQIPDFAEVQVRFYDKAVHFFEFFIFGLLLGRALLKEHGLSMISQARKVGILFSILVLSSSTEIVQIFISHRMPGWADFAANLAGCLSGLISYFFETGLIQWRRGEKTIYSRFADYALLKRIYFWFPALLIYALISFYSHQPPQVLYTQYLPPPRLLIPMPTTVSWDPLHGLWSLHFVEFMCLGFFLGRAVSWERIWKPSMNWGRLITMALILLAGLAYIDEWHQGLIPGRVNTWSDVVSNILGGGIGLLIYWKGYQPLRYR